MAPVPACVVRLPARYGKRRAFSRSLRDEQIWNLVFPTFDPEKRELPDRPSVCTGRKPYEDPLLHGADVDRGWPRRVTDHDLLVGSGGNQLRIAWFRTHAWSDETVGGPLALVRAQGDFAEAYAIGSYKAKSPKPIFATERMGTEIAVTAQDDRCTGVPGACENTLTVFLPFKGELVPAAVIPLERRVFMVGGEPGSTGKTQYKLTSAPRYVDGGIKLYEQVLALDEEGHELRRAELERMFTIRDAELVPSDAALWPRIFPAARVEPMADGH